MVEIHKFSKKVLKEQKQEFGVLVLVAVRRRRVGGRSVLGKRNLKAMNNIPIAS